MKNVFLWGFCSEIEGIGLRLRASDELNVPVWIATHEESTYTIFDFFSARVPFGQFTGKSLPYHETLRPHLLTFMDMFSRHERYTGQGNFHEIQNVFNLSLDMLAELLIENRIDTVVFSNIPHEGTDYLLYTLAKAMRLETLLLYQSVFPNRFQYCSSMEDFSRASAQPVLRPPQPYSTQAFRSDVGRMPRLLPSSLFQRPIARPRGLRKLRGRYHKRRLDCVTYHVEQENARFVERYRALFGPPPDPSGPPFIYFPLHYQPELTTSALGGRFSDQLLALETLSRWVPGDVTLMVKENPAQDSVMRGRLFFERLKRIPNVHVVPIETSTYDLIEGAALVATVTGTAGWEALCMGKPVLALGAPWYRELPGVFEFDESLDYRQIVQHRFEREKLEAAVGELLARMPAGVVDPAYAGMVEDFSPETNAEMVSRFLADYLLGRLDAPPKLETLS